MRMKTVLATLAMPLLFTGSGCGSGGGPQPDSIAIEASDSSDIESGALLTIKDKGTLLRLVGRDANGDEVDLDPAGIAWSSSDETALETRPLGGSCIVKGAKDWFDTVAEGADPSTGYEPSATLTVTYGGLTATLPAAVVLNGHGLWDVQVSGGTLNGSEIELDLVQHGRTLTHETTGAMAQINGRAFAISQLGFTFTGDFTTRTTLEGTYTAGSSQQGDWSAEKK